jgi:transposase
MEGSQVVSEAAVAVLGMVAAPEVGVEIPVISKERWEALRQMHAEGQTVSQIARTTGLDRKTVRGCLRKPEWLPYRRAPLAETLLSTHQTWLTERAPLVNYSARILFQELRATRGYQGGYDTVRNAVRPLRTEAAATALTQCRFETEPGEQAQVDWGQVRVQFATGPTSVHVFMMTLGYSRRAWAEGYENEQLGALLAAHEHAFTHFGGRPAELLYDRMRTVTMKPAADKAKWNPTFASFFRHWGFEPRLCRPYRAQTKGKVESGVKYVKRNFVPGRTFVDLVDFNEQLVAWLAEVADVRVHGTTHERPIDRFAREAGALVCTLDQPSFFQALRRERVVADDWLVAIDANRYSVPWRLIGKTVDVVRAGAMWQISHRGQVVAEHLVLTGRHQLQVDPAHGPGAAARNVRTRFSTPTTAPAANDVQTVEVRDLEVYEQLLEVA